jgi:hypothetical protein
MAIVGLLELMAAQDATVDDMLETAKMVNSYWFPTQSQELALSLYLRWSRKDSFSCHLC